MSVRKTLLTAIAVALLLAPVLAGIGLATPAAEAAPPRQDAADQRTITVTGYGVSYGVPDLVRVGLGVESVNTDIADAMDDVNTRMDNVIQALQDAGVAPEDIRTEYFNISQDYGAPMPMDAASSAQTQGRPYRVSTTVRVTIRDAQQVGTLLSAAVDAGANLVNYVEFDIADRAALESDAREAAVSDAEARAEELAGLLGLSVGEPLKVVEGSDVAPIFGGRGGGTVAALESAVISQGTLSVNMNVTITYALQ